MEGGLRRLQGSLDPSHSGLMSGVTGKSLPRTAASRVNPLSGRTTQGAQHGGEPGSGQLFGIKGRTTGLSGSNTGVTPTAQRAGLMSMPSHGGQ